VYNYWCYHTTASLSAWIAWKAGVRSPFTTSPCASASVSLSFLQVSACT